MFAKLLYKTIWDNSTKQKCKKMRTYRKCKKNDHFKLFLQHMYIPNNLFWTVLKSSILPNTRANSMMHRVCRSSTAQQHYEPEQLAKVRLAVPASVFHQNWMRLYHADYILPKTFADSISVEHLWIVGLPWKGSRAKIPLSLRRLSI